MKKLRLTIVTFVPAIIALVIVWGSWDAFEIPVIYLPQLLFVPISLILLPLAVHIYLWNCPNSRHIPHPYAIVLPLSFLLIIPLWPLGEMLARRCSALCEMAYYAEIKPNGCSRTDPRVQATFFWAPVEAPP
jgi:hypothetical protein